MYIILLFILIILCALCVLCVFCTLHIFWRAYNNTNSGGAQNHKSNEYNKTRNEYNNKTRNDNIIKKNIDGVLNKYFKHSRNMGDIVIDTLNAIMYIYNNKLSIQRICAGIEYISKKLKRFFHGRLMFVIKDRDNVFNTPEVREAYKKLAQLLKIYIYIAEKYETNAPSWKGPNSYTHSIKGRDDLATIILAKKFNCPILTNDNFSDSAEFRSTVAPFKLLEYNWFSAKLPIIETYKPEDLKKNSPNTRIKLHLIFTENEML
jgi:hypothetical protein